MDFFFDLGKLLLIITLLVLTVTEKKCSLSHLGHFTRLEARCVQVCLGVEQALIEWEYFLWHRSPKEPDISLNFFPLVLGEGMEHWVLFPYVTLLWVGVD